MLSGYHFRDNKIDMRFGPENGYATFNTGKPIPEQVKAKKMFVKDMKLYTCIQTFLSLRFLDVLKSLLNLIDMADK